MKRVTNKTAMNIYQRWMTIIHMKLPFIYDDMSVKAAIKHLDAVANLDDSIIKFNWVLNDYNDTQIKKIITGLEQGTQWEANYLAKEILHLLKSHLRERKLNKLI